MLREDAQTAEMELIATQYRGRARVLQAKLFVLLKVCYKLPAEPCPAGFTLKCIQNKL